MPDFRPFRALRYRADDAGDCIAPPYDVIDAEQQAALHERSPHNVIRLELGEQRDGDSTEDNRYTRAATTLREWRSSGALAFDALPAFYVHTHEFLHEGKRHRRTALFGRLRLEPWESGSVRPHEETMRGPKEDRLQLLRALRTNVSPIFALYRDGSATAALMERATPLFDTETPEGDRHALAALTEPEAIESIAAALREQPAYILDGHHRFETALAYRDECRKRASDWTGEEPENFVLAALAAADDPGLLLLPIHRLVRPKSVPKDVVASLERFFDIDDITPKSYDGTALLRLLGRLSAAGRNGSAIGALGLEETRLQLLKLRETAAARALMPERSPVWQSLDVNVLEYAVLRETFDMPEDTEDIVEYTPDAEHAFREVEAGRWPLAFLLNPTGIDQMLAVADAGERTPPKTTYFYPKLPTGLVLNAFE